MNNTHVRDAITFDEVDRSVADHLERCQACREFADDMRRLETLAPQLAAIPPDGLAERIMEAVPTSAENVVVPLRRGEGPGGWRKASRSLGVRLTSAAAVLLLVVGALTTVLGRQSTNPDDIVLASAESTADAGRAAVRVRASTEIVLRAPQPRRPGEMPPPPDFSAAPVELRGQLEAQWAMTMARFEEQMQDFFKEVDGQLGDATDQMEDALRQMQRQFDRSLRQFGGDVDRQPVRPLPPRPPRRVQPSGGNAPGATPQPPTAPRGVSAEVLVDARGLVDFDDERLELRGAVSSGTGDAAFALGADADSAVYRAHGGQWTRLSGRAGTIGAVVLNPDAVLHVARSAKGVTAEGSAVVDGETMQRYTFDVDARALGDTESGGRWQAAAFVGADGRLHRMNLTSRQQADSASWRTRITVDLSAHGETAPARMLPAPGRSTDLPERSSLPLYPFNESLGAARGVER